MTATATETETETREPLAVRHLSAASVDRYRTCPKRFWYQDVSRLPTGSEPSPVLAQANAVHHALERFFGLPVDDRSLEGLHRALRAVWSQHRGIAFASRDEEAAFGREALDMLAMFASRFDLTVQPIARERRFRIRLSMRPPIVGKVDRIDSCTSGVHVIDYKTGRHALDDDDLPADSASLIYAVAAEQLLGRPVRSVRHIYLRSGTEAVWQLEDEDRASCRSRLERLCGEILAADVFPGVTGPHCSWCPYDLHCEERQRVSLDELDVPEGIPF